MFKKYFYFWSVYKFKQILSLCRTIDIFNEETMPINKVNIPKAIKTAIHTPIYNEIRELRKTATYKEMAQAFDTNPTTINNILNGEIEKVSLDRLIPIADKMGIEINIVTTQAGEDTVTKLTK